MKYFKVGVDTPIEFLGQGYKWHPAPFPALAIIVGPQQGLYKAENLLESFTGFEIKKLRTGERIKLIDNDQNEATYKVEKGIQVGGDLRLKKLK